MGLLVFRAARTGVRETVEGIVCREGVRRGQFAWSEIAEIGYVRAWGRERMIVKLVDGSRAVVPGARRHMQWRSAQTSSDFAALLDHRREVFVHAGDPESEAAQAGVAPTQPR